MIFVYYSYINLKFGAIVHITFWFLSVSLTFLLSFSRGAVFFLLLKQLSVLLMPGNSALTILFDLEFSPKPLCRDAFLSSSLISNTILFKWPFLIRLQIALSYHLVYFPPGMRHICNCFAYLLICHLPFQIWSPSAVNTESDSGSCFSRAGVASLRWKIPRYSRWMSDWKAAGMLSHHLSRIYYPLNQSKPSLFWHIMLGGFGFLWTVSCSIDSNPLWDCPTPEVINGVG